MKRGCLTALISIFLSSSAIAETVMNPSDQWWGQLFDQINGIGVDYDTLARNDAAYRAADEFTRDAVLAEVITRLQSESEQIDLESLEVVMLVNTEFGDFVASEGAFPVTIFQPDVYLRLGHGNNLYFRNHADARFLPVTPEQGRDIRQQLGNRAAIAEISLSGFRSSPTRRGFDAHVNSANYYAASGNLLGSFIAEEEVLLSESELAAGIGAARDLIVNAAGIPAIGTSWTDAKENLIAEYPIVVSYADRGGAFGLIAREGAIESDSAHDLAQSFNVYLHQVDAEWMPSNQARGSQSVARVMADIRGQSTELTKELGPGLACYTPDDLDRCAVLEFVPSDAGGHVLARAYGVIEVPPEATLEVNFHAFAGDTSLFFDGLETAVSYDAGEMATGMKTAFVNNARVPAYAAGAGEQRTTAQIYDPLKYISGAGMNREVELFAVGSGTGRVPMIFVLQ